MLRLRGNPDFDHVVGLIRGYGAEYMTVLMTAQDEVQLRRAQGAIEALNQIVEDYESAPATIEKLKR